ncbi:MAG TPA: phosphoribosylanthranilate isomerase [Alphaproteobacteria bacterium]|nr:phosphoribosylanthranilate isomerase [Alphaproteobacteria bacterium]
MTRIKVCGITRPEDAAQAAALGAWALGFVFAKSPRRIQPGQAARIASGLPEGILKVGVFVDEAPNLIEAVAEEVGLDLIQLHGTEPAETCDLLGRDRVIKAIRVRCEESLAQAADYVGHCFAVLLDAWDPLAAGGTGKSWDWSLASPERLPRLILAGGLGLDNVDEAIRLVGPWALDVSSGVEAAPGIKDPELLQAFFQAVREAE